MSRVNQLDASLLDSELLTQFKDQLTAAFKFWHPDFKDRYEHELMLALRALLFKVTVYDHSATYGAKLQNLVLVDARSGRKIGRRLKCAYAAAVVVFPYVWSKLSSGGVLGATAQSRLHALTGAATLANFVAFLFRGEYLTMIMRLLRVRYATADGSQKPLRNVNYEFQNRQLVWNALTEFLLFLLPIINFKQLFRRLVRPWMHQRRAENQAGPLAHLSSRMCAICFETDAELAAHGATNPHTGGCAHAYCYVCLSRRLLDQPGWQCLRCNAPLRHENLMPLQSIP